MAFCACNTSSTNTTLATQTDSVISDTTGFSTYIADTSTFENEEAEKKAVYAFTLKFNELSISIYNFSTDREGGEADQIQGDTVEIYAELGETIEGQLISVSSDQLTDLQVEQRYETSVTIMNEGPHCDLKDWKHFYSEWNKLQVNSEGEFTCDEYTEKESEKFPKISINDLKQTVKEKCSEGWLELIENIKKPTEYPSGVTISRYYLRVSGQRKNNGQTVTKLIIIEMPMGC